MTTAIHWRPKPIGRSMSTDGQFVGILLEATRTLPPREGGRKLITNDSKAHHFILGAYFVVMQMATQGNATTRELLAELVTDLSNGDVEMWEEIPF